MKSYDYHGWKVSAKDVMYRRLLKEDKNITLQDIDPMNKIIKEHIPFQRTALDIGCHYGFFTKFLASKFDHVHAFDFNNDIHHFFKKNMKKFKIKNLTIHPYGIGNNNMNVAINDFFYRKKWSGYGPLGTHIDPEGKDKKYTIKTLDSLNIKDVDLIMIDTEGYELPVLKGGIKTISKYKPVLVVEFHLLPKIGRPILTKKFGYRLSELDIFIRNLGYNFICNINKVDRVYAPVCINNLQY